MAFAITAPKAAGTPGPSARGTGSFMIARIWRASVSDANAARPVSKVNSVDPSP
jgi:hypothetical protein